MESIEVGTIQRNPKGITTARAYVLLELLLPAEVDELPNCTNPVTLYMYNTNILIKLYLIQNKKMNNKNFERTITIILTNKKNVTTFRIVILR